MNFMDHSLEPQDRALAISKAADAFSNEIKELATRNLSYQEALEQIVATTKDDNARAIAKRVLSM